ncbi:MAG: aconitate hydratase AcnA [Alphaproteobacteria bacterium]|nr:aconitate hydratase AcnA [Alphaproteobacteria bacterium]
MTDKRDSLHTRSTMIVNGREYDYYSLDKAAQALGLDIAHMPITHKILLENLLRHEDGKTVTASDIQALIRQEKDREIAYRPARVLMQDFTGVPAVVDLAAMRDAMQSLGGKPAQINPLSAVDLVIDHSVQVDAYATDDAFDINVKLEMERNVERYKFLRWGQSAFKNFRVVPPGTGICHQVNLEYLAKVVWSDTEGTRTVVYPDTLVGTDSHTTMINGLAVLGWGVGGIEAEAAMLGQPTAMVIPEVVGFKLTGKLKEGVTATDLVLTVTNILRKHGVVEKFVEFFGEGLDHLSLADRATIANMAPEYGATCGYFPIDQETIRYLQLSHRDPELISLVEAYAKTQELWRDNNKQPNFNEVLELDLSSVEPCIAGPKRPQDKIVLSNVANSVVGPTGKDGKPAILTDKRFDVAGNDFNIGNGDVVIAAITSCTNTSNPGVMLGAGLVARKAVEKGLTVKPWVKTSLAPGSKVVTAYYEASGLNTYLDALGFNLVGYGCTTCIGNSGPMDPAIEKTIAENNLTVASVLSGNRNFEGRIHPLTQINYLGSPMLVVAYALAGTMKIDLAHDPLGKGTDGQDVFLKDIWPTSQEIQDVVAKSIKPAMFADKYGIVFEGDKHWQSLSSKPTETYDWDDKSTYIKNPPYFAQMGLDIGVAKDIKGASILALLADSITTDHISPAGSISKNSPAAHYLIHQGVQPADFNSYGSRRGNHEVMMRGTFANIRIRNELAPGTEGGFTTHIPSGEVMPIYDASMKYQAAGTELVIIGGKEYGTGSSRDWAAKGTKLLGVKAVIAESFERIHRSNLVGMGILPLTFKPGVTRKTLNLTGKETIDISGLEHGITPRMDVTCTITRADGTSVSVPLTCRIDTDNEVEYYLHGGILHYTIRKLMRQSVA